MAVKIRLSRHGKKNHAFFHIVVADIRAPRDGRYIEQLGIYNPNTNPATIKLDAERALYWLNTGAQPTDTAEAKVNQERAEAISKRKAEEAAAKAEAEAKAKAEAEAAEAAANAENTEAPAAE